MGEFEHVEDEEGFVLLSSEMLGDVVDEVVAVLAAVVESIAEDWLIVSCSFAIIVPLLDKDMEVALNKTCEGVGFDDELFELFDEDKEVSWEVFDVEQITMGDTESNKLVFVIIGDFAFNILSFGEH